MKRRIDAPTSAATTWPKNSTARCWPGLRPKACPKPQAPLNSESPGLMIDRLSILALKIYHTREEADRAERARRPQRAQSRPAGDS